MTGTIVNSLAIVVAGLLGFAVKKAVPNKMEKPIMQMIGLAVILIAIEGFLSSTITVQDGQFKTSGEILTLVSLVVGVAIGEALKLDDAIGNFGKYIEKKAGIDGFAKSFVTASILFCVGAMAIFGPLQDGISGDSSVLFVKSAIDGITAFILSATLGIGVCFAGVSVFVYQGATALLAIFIAPSISPQMMNNICMVGYAIMITIGTNMLEMTKVKTINIVPAMVVPIIYTLLF